MLLFIRILPRASLRNNMEGTSRMSNAARYVQTAVICLSTTTYADYWVPRLWNRT